MPAEQVDVDTTPVAHEAPAAPQQDDGREQLAHTGSNDTTTGLGIAGGLLIAGGGAVFLARRAQRT